MTQSLVTVLLFIGVIACLPFVLKWVKQRTGGPLGGAANQARFVSAVLVGPNQRVVTVEVGPEGSRVWLTVGVTSQAITRLHVASCHAAPTMPLASGVTHD